MNVFLASPERFFVAAVLLQVDILSCRAVANADVCQAIKESVQAISVYSFIAVLRMDLNSIRRGVVGSEGAVASGLMRRSVKSKCRHSANGYNRQ